VTNLLDTIIPKSDQLNSDDLIGRTMTITVTAVSRTDSPEQPIALSFEGDNGKPFKPCKSMRRVLVNIWGPDGNAYAGRSMSLYRDDTVRFGGAEVGGIRISHMSHMTKPVTMALTATRANRKPFVVKPLVAQKEPETPKTDRVADGVAALIERINAAGNEDALTAMLADPNTDKQLAFLDKNRPELAERVTAAIAAVQAAFAGGDEVFPGDAA